MAYKKHEKTHDQELIVTYRMIPTILALAVFLLGTSFFAGFFWGQRYKAEQFLERFEHDTLSDQIYSSMFSLYDSGFESNQLQPSSPAEQQSSEPKLADEPNEEASSDLVMAESTSTQERVADLSTNYYAQLVGFGSRNRAESFVKKLAARGIQVQLQKRLGKSPKNGKTTTWYQVTTPIFNDRHTLESLVARLGKEEKLHDIRIITLT